MARYRFQQTYRSGYGAGDEGDEVELTIDEAQAINRDAPGTLVMVREKHDEADTRAPDAPAHDRQVKRAPQKRAVSDGK